MPDFGTILQNVAENLGAGLGGPEVAQQILQRRAIEANKRQQEQQQFRQTLSGLAGSGDLEGVQKLKDNALKAGMDPAQYGALERQAAFAHGEHEATAKGLDDWEQHDRQFNNSADADTIRMLRMANQNPRMGQLVKQVVETAGQLHGKLLAHQFRSQEIEQRGAEQEKLQSEREAARPSKAPKAPKAVDPTKLASTVAKGRASLDKLSEKFFSQSGSDQEANFDAAQQAYIDAAASVRGLDFRDALERMPIKLTVPGTIYGTNNVYVKGTKQLFDTLAPQNPVNLHTKQPVDRKELLQAMQSLYNTRGIGAALKLAQAYGADVGDVAAQLTQLKNHLTPAGEPSEEAPPTAEPPPNDAE